MENNKSTIYLATDHAGLDHKNALLLYLKGEGYEVVDCGAVTHDPYDDYPAYIEKAAEAVSLNPDVDKAIIFGGSGQGEAMLANRFRRVRAVVFYGGDQEIIKLSREHNDANVLSIGARFLSQERLEEVVHIWLNTSPLPDEKYARRIEAVKKITDQMY
ncbi:RpiB/LacA/LacB family sugar-phosphate isomerase [Candidatus Pacebacteria bacterium]|nr:RpiB/LacA/LacB family sugar-phosphate isomerase [Candidatus Paceibacterota bacterium]